MDYQFRDLEKKWQKFWAEKQTYKVENNSSKPKYYVLDMFPYPSGAGLHVGHPLGYIASDIFARYKRLKGFNVLHPMGYDSFGLPAEQYAIQTGQHPALTTEQNIATYRRQLDQIGFSFDWSREVRTSDPSYYKWTQWIFMQLFNSWYNLEADKAEPIEKLIAHFESKGSEGISAVSDDEILSFSADEWKQMPEADQQRELLKYRITYLRESTVNWCAALGTVLANDEVKDGVSERGGHPVEQKKMMQWSMRITAYADRLLQGLDTIDWPEPLKEMQRNWIGKSTGASVKFSLTPTLSGGEGVETPGYKTADPHIWEILKANARENRKEQTDAEDVLWQSLRNSQIGYKIRRQHPIGTYIADFVCLKKGLIVEVDGAYHQEIKEQDALRTEALNQLGFEVLRFTNAEVIADIHQVLNFIKQKLHERPDRVLNDSSSLSSGEGRGEAYIEVFTTRVDTIFGVSFLVIAPEHELVAALTTPEQKEEIENYIAQTKKKSELDRMADAKTVSGAFTGSYVLNPLNGAKVPVYIADYVLAGYGTGAVMAVPSGDQRDWLFAKHFNLPIIQILDGQQNIDTEADPTKDGRYINSDFINGLTYQEAIPVLNQKLEELQAGKAKIQYRMRDAIFGRQRYWGEPVPVYFKNGLPYLIDEQDLPLLLPEVDKYLPTESGEPPLGRAKDWKYKDEYEYELSTMPGWAGSSWYWYRYMTSADERNKNVFAPENAIDYWKDVDLYIGGNEHATGHLLYSRFWNKFLKDLGYVKEEEPFKKLINQGMIQGRSSIVYRVIFDDDPKGYPPLLLSKNVYEDYKESVTSEGRPFLNNDLKELVATEFNQLVSEKIPYSNNRTFIPIHVDVNIVENDILNTEKLKTQLPEYKEAIFISENGKFYCDHVVEKMSKRYYNVVNPDDIVERYGADTLRLYEMFLGPLEQSKPWNTNGIEGVFKFLRKLWRLFHDDQFNFNVSDAEPTKAELKALHKIIHKVEEDIERFSFNTSVSSFMICVNELTDLKCNKRKVLQDLVIVLAPYAPHITEELWTLLGNEAGSISYASFPVFNPSYLVEDEFAYPISINGKMKMNLNMSLTLEPSDIEKFVLQHADVQKYLDGKLPKKVIVVKGKIVNLVV